MKSHSPLVAWIVAASLWDRVAAMPKRARDYDEDVEKVDVQEREGDDFGMSRIGDEGGPKWANVARPQVTLACCICHIRACEDNIAKYSVFGSACVQGRFAQGMQGEHAQPLASYRASLAFDLAVVLGVNADYTWFAAIASGIVSGIAIAQRSTEAQPAENATSQGDTWTSRPDGFANNPTAVVGVFWLKY